MDITELKGIDVDLITVRKIVCVKHSLVWEEWTEDAARPKPNQHGMYSLYDVYCWLGY